MKWKDINDNFGRRRKGDRRQKPTSGRFKERRSGLERRKIPDRRINDDRRKNEKINAIDPKILKKRNPVDRRDFIFDDTE